MSQLSMPLLQVPGGPELLIVGLILLVMLVMAAVWLGLAYWVYKDATKRNMDNPAIWGLITFVAGVFGLALYIVVRE